MPRMILHKLSTQRVKRCPTGCGYFLDSSRRPRGNSRRITFVSANHPGFAGIESPSVKREIAINASALEVRVALLEDNELAEFYLERNRQVGLAGNIYKGKVTRVLPGMQAAFVDIGLEKAGFLHVSDFHDGVSALNNVAEVLGEEDVETEPVGESEFAERGAESR